MLMLCTVETQGSIWLGGRESSFQERYSHEPSGSQLMSPWGAAASGGTEVGP